MPKKLTIQDIKDRYEKYGYFIQDDIYRNNKYKMTVFDAQLGKNVKLSVQNMNYSIKKKKRSEYDINEILPVALNPEQIPREHFDIFNVLPTQHNPERPTKQSPMRRFMNRLANSPILADATEDEKKQMFEYYNMLVKQFGRRKPLTIQWSQSKMRSRHQLLVFIEALKTIIRPNKMIRIKTIDSDGVESNYSLTHETLNYFTDLLNDKPKNEMSDSNNDLFDDHANWIRVELVFDIDIKQHGGFFPYINKSSYNLDAFGIFSEFDLNNYSTNCFIQALQNSNVFNSAEMELIQSCVNTRLVKIEDIQVISNMMDAHFIVRIWNEAGNKWDFKQFRPKSNNIRRKITILLYQYHFMANQQVHITKYYIEHHRELDEKYPGDTKRFLILNDEGKIGEGKMGIVTMIKYFHENNLFEPISVNDQLKIALQYHRKYITGHDVIIGEYFREKIVEPRDVKQVAGFSKYRHYDGYKLFCEHLSPRELDEYYDKLQTIMGVLKIDLDVRAYTSYPSLMEAIMYKYGCFDNVYELAGPLAKQVRDKLVFPVPHTADNKPFYSNQKLYYIDLNGAYLSCVKSIPAGICDENLVFPEQNSKIKELIERMYKIRTKLKSIDTILYKMMKQLMTCCWGLSIRREKVFNKCKPKDRETFINQNLGYVVEEGIDFIKTLSSISVCYSYPQFAKQVLDNFHEKMNSVASIVKHIYYYNIDAILIDEDDYNRVVAAGLVGNDLGMFKIEHVFTEIAIKSARNYVATLEDGTKFYHTGNKTVDYDEYVSTIRSSPDITVLSCVRDL